MSTLQKVLACGLSLAVAFAAGRYTVPSVVKTVTNSVDSSKQAQKQDTQTVRHKEVTVTETTKPDGTKTKVTKTITDTDRKSDTKSVSLDNSATQTSKEVTKKSGISVSALAGLSAHDLTSPVYGLSLQAPVLGPITAGAWGLSDLTFGVSLGINF